MWWDMLQVRRTISPISLRVMIQTARLAEMTRAFSQDELAEFLTTSSEMSGRIACEAVRAGLIRCEGNRFFTTPSCSRFLELRQVSDRAGLHEMLMNHPGYAFFITLLRSASSISLEDCMNHRQPGPPRPFGRAGLNMVCSWAEDCGSVQQNCYTGQHYPVGELRAPFVPFFKKMYHLLEIPAGPLDRKKPVPIQILREFVCQRLRIAREDFDARVRAMCEQSPEEFILSRPGGNHRKKIVRMKGRCCNGRDFFREGFSLGSSRDGVEIRGRRYRFILCRDREEQ